ncbi:MAG TPA: DUF3500 domain-containing protein, partial [Opitutaceae bacterium]|nr:DUF3500 domain-containing protein [Opitutaceae bacterium]
MLRAHDVVPATMNEAARSFLDTLSDGQRKTVQYKVNDAERETWFFIPRTRAGIPLKQMTEAQRIKALALLKSGLSEHGDAQAEAIIAMENVLFEMEHTTRRDPTLYYLTIFGEPSLDHTWGWRFEGHHLSINFTIVDGKHVFFTPSFFGSNPAEVRIEMKKGLRIFADEEDMGRQFVTALDKEQRSIGIISEYAPEEILTSNKPRVDPLHPDGIGWDQLNDAQRSKLLDLVKLYANRLRGELAEAELQKIQKEGWSHLHFAWAGGIGKDDKHY